MRLTPRLGLGLAALLVATPPARAAAPPAAAPAPAAPAAAPDPEDILGDLVVEARRRSVEALRLPKIGVEAPGDDEAARALLAVLRRDLDLSFELEVVELPADADASDAAADPGPPGASLERWRRAGAEYVVRAAVAVKDDDAAELSVALYSLADGDGPVFRRALVAAAGQRRLTAHRLADAVLGAITGYAGPFASQLTFVRSEGGTRRVQVIDADGDGLATRSPVERVAVSPTFGPGGALWYAASVDRGRYRLYREDEPAPLAVPVIGSIYGVAFSDDRSQIALAIAVDGEVRVFVGPADLSTLEPRSSLPLALHPVFSPRGQIAYAGTARVLQRIYLEGRAISDRGLVAAAPTFCRSPAGTRVVYSVAVGAREDLIATDERGGDTVRLTSGKGKNRFPACSPDGRLVAFFSDRKGGEGPGLYLMRVDGRRPPKKIADAVGDTLRWARAP